jgi:hypothetical protein
MGLITFLSGQLEKWQRSKGLELIKFTDPYGVPIYDEDGGRIRNADVSNLMSILDEVIRRARADPLHAIDWKAAIRKHAEIVGREVESERDASKFNRRRKKRRRRK